MKRDMDLIRLLLLEVEGEREVDLAGYTKEKQSYHRVLLIDASLVDGDYSMGMDERGESRVKHVYIRRLTWAGHDFLDAARDNTVWNEAQQTIREKVGTVAFDVLKALLVAIATKRILPI